MQATSECDALDAQQSCLPDLLPANAGDVSNTDKAIESPKRAIFITMYYTQKPANEHQRTQEASRSVFPTLPKNPVRRLWRRRGWFDLRRICLREYQGSGDRECTFGSRASRAWPRKPDHIPLSR